MKVYSNGYGHLIQMSSTHIYGKTRLKLHSIVQLLAKTYLKLHYFNVFAKV